MKFRRVMFLDKNDNGHILAESPDTVYGRVILSEATWKAVDPTDTSPWGYLFEVFGMKFLDHHEDGIQAMNKADRAAMLEWSTTATLMAEVIDAPEDAPDGVQVGSMVWLIMDDLAEQDKVHVWMQFFEHGVRLS